MCVRTAALGVIVAGLLGAVGGRDDARAEPFPLDLAFSMRRTFADFERGVVSPSGSHVAYGVVAAGRRRDDVWTLPSGLPVPMAGTRLNVVEAATGRSVALGAEGSASFSPAWSPDGSALAYFSDEGGALRAWVYDVAAGKARPVADVRIKVHLYTTGLMPPAWSPDGRFLLVPALPADEAGADPRPPRGSATARKSGTLVLTSGAEPAPPPEARAATFSHYDSAVDVTAVDLRDGTTRVLLPARRPGRSGPAFARYSPSGRFLVYVSQMRPGRSAEADDVLDIGVVKTGETEPLYVEEIARLYEGRESYAGGHMGRSGVVLAWHPTDDVLLFLNDNRLRRLDCTQGDKPHADGLAADWGRLSGSYLAFARGGRSVLVGLLPDGAPPDSHRLSALGLVPLDGGPPRKLTLPDGVDSGQLVRRGGGLLWEPVADTATLLTVADGGAGTAVRRVDLAGGGWTTVRTDSATVDFHGASRDGSTLVGTVERYDRPVDVYRLEPDFAPRDRLGAVEPRLDGRDVGRFETFRTVVPLHDGRRKSVRTAVLLPPGSKKGDRLPALVALYGGSDLSRSVNKYGGGYVSTIPAPVFTTRGFAVVLVDAPLGPDGRPAQPADDLRDAVLPQVYRAAELGYVDIDRVAVTGQSYGGYCTAALVSTTHLFRAAVSFSGIYDLASMSSAFRPGDDFGVWWTEKGQGRMGRPPWSDLRRYVDNSPYFRADRILTPLLIVHGRDDSACPVNDAEKMFSALKRLGRTAQLAVYEGDGHVVYEWDPKHAADATERMLDFLRRHLGERRGRAAAE